MPARGALLRAPGRCRRAFSARHALRLAAVTAWQRRRACVRYFSPTTCACCLVSMERLQNLRLLMQLSER